MCPQQQPKKLFTRSEFLRMSAGTVAAAAAVGSLSSSCGGSGAADIDSLLGELDEKVQAGMQEYGIPGVGLGLVYQDTDYTWGYGVTNVDDPQQQVDVDTLFLIGSTTKTFTGTAAMRLVDQGKLDLDAPVQTYLPDFATSDPAVASRVTVRQLLNHTPGWLGEDPHDTGSGDDALARFVADIERLPQLTPPGEVFQYNNVGFSLAGRLIEVATGSTYEEALRELVLDPLGMSRSRFFSDESELVGSLADSNVAGPHSIEDGEPVLDTSLFADMHRHIRPAGGLFSSVRDLMQYATFHLGDGRAQDGTRLLTNESLVAMRSNPGPGGTLILELDGVGVGWELRPSAEGVPIVEKGGDWPGWHTGFTMVPEQGFALFVLTNSEGGPKLLRDLILDDWALRRFAGVSNTPAEPLTLTQAELAPYEGLYTGQVMLDEGLQPFNTELKADNGQLHMTLMNPESTAVPADPEYIAEPEDMEPWVEQRLAFYRDDYVLVYDAESGEPTGTRADFIRDADGNVEWLRWGGRLFRHPGAT